MKKLKRGAKGEGRRHGQYTTPLAECETLQTCGFLKHEVA